MKSFFQVFSSVRLVIFLLIVITLASVLGTLIPQHRSPEEYQAKYGDLSSLLIRMEITRLYQSWWYLSFLFLFALNMVVCTLTRFPSKLKRVISPPVSIHPNRISAFKEHEKLKKTGDAAAVKEKLRRALKKRRYRIKEENKENQCYILARKKTLGIFGPDIVHTGILIIIFGGILSGIGGFRGNLNIIEGSTADVPHADFQIRLDKFETEYYPSGAVRAWKSTLTVIASGREKTTETIKVNHPLSYQGFVFYQSSYGWDWNNPRLDILVRKPGEESPEERIRISVGEKHTLRDDVTEIAARAFVPDFVITEGNRVTTRSLQPNNPAVYLESFRSGEVIFRGWVFAEFPDFSPSHPDGEQEISFVLEDFQAPQYSGIQVARDPGTNVIWAGCAVLMLGLFAAFYWPSRTLRFHLADFGSHAEIAAGGESKKNREEFRSEFQSILSELRRVT